MLALLEDYTSTDSNWHILDQVPYLEQMSNFAAWPPATALSGLYLGWRPRVFTMMQEDEFQSLQGSLP